MYKHRVANQYGVFTRDSVRRYQYLVIAVGQREDVMVQRANAALARNQKTVTEYRAKAAAGGTSEPMGSYGMHVITAEQYTVWADSAQAEIDAHVNRLAAALTENRSAILANKGLELGWSGTQKNAEKVAQAARAYYAKTLVIPVTNADVRETVKRAAKVTA